MTKSKQINQTGSWLEQKAQDQSAALKGRKASGALEEATVNSLGSNSVHKNVHDEHEIEVDFEVSSPEEQEEQPALSGGQLPLEQPALSGGQLP